MTETKKPVPNHKIYAEMCVPHDGADATNAAIDAFYADVNAARRKHRISDVSIVVRAFCKYEDDGPVPVLTSAHVGNPDNEESMLAFAFGGAKAARRQRINILADGGGVAKA
jgi:hypothetical protein